MPNEKGWLFATHNGTPLNQNLIVKRKLQPLLISLGMNRGGLHAFRHGNILIMDRLGVPLKIRMQRIGHSDPAMTLGPYTHIASKDDLKFAEQLGGIFAPQCAQVERRRGYPWWVTHCELRNWIL